MVAEWEIAKKAYTLRNLNWKIAPGMINLCDEIAKEMIEIDRTIEAISCFGRYEMASYLMRTIKVWYEYIIIKICINNSKMIFLLQICL